MKAGGDLSPAVLSQGLAHSLLAVSWLPFYPLLKFKPEARTLEIGSDGISTSVGKRSGRRACSEIRSASAQDDEIVILGKNGNAFIVPTRAFPSAKEHQHFLSFAQTAHKMNSA